MNRRSRIPTAAAWMLVLLTTGWGCSEEDGTQPPPPDTMPPSVISDLRVESTLGGTVELSWKAPGDDGSDGRASQYAIRYSATPLTEAVFDSAIAWPSPIPQSAGEEEGVTVSKLAHGTWYFGIKAADEIPNWSSLSNVISTSIADTIPPAAVSDLRVASVMGTSVVLAWTAPGGDGLEGQAVEYDVRYLQQPIDLESWEDATPISELPDPAAPETKESFPVSGLPGATTYYFALRSADSAGNWSALSNVATVTTGDDTTPPDPVLDLRVSEVAENSIALIWTATGSDGSEGRADAYDLRYSPDPIDLETWADAIAVPGLPRPKPAGATETLEVSGLETLTTYYFALRAVDPAGKWSALSNQVDQSTSRLVRLTSSTAGSGAFHPTWSPDGQTLALSANWQDPSGFRDIHLLPAEGGEPIQLTHGPGDESSPSWSPDGARLVYVYTGYTDSGAAELWTVDAAPGAEARLLWSHGERDVIHCDWSPDGSQIVIVLALSNDAAELYLLPAEGGPPLFLAGGLGEDIYDARWSPDGSRIAFTSTRGSDPGDPDPNVWVISALGGDPHQLTDGGSDSSPVWSPDGMRIAFSSSRGGMGADIWTMAESGDHLVRWNYDPNFSSYPSDWASDGTRICFIARETPSQIYDVWTLQLE